jgi:hypothetical protein
MLAQDTGQKTSRHSRSRLPAVECKGRLSFNNQHARLRAGALEQDTLGGTGKSAANDDHIVFRAHEMVKKNVGWIVSGAMPE